MMLDITIRTASGDQVARRRFASSLQRILQKGKNYTPADFQKIAEIDGRPQPRRFLRKVRPRTAEIEYSAIVSGIGLKMNERQTGSGRAYIGADTAGEKGRVTVRSIPAGSPAYEQGLNTGDQIIAIDGYRASSAFMTSYLGERKPNDVVKLTIFRFDKMRDITFTLGSDARKDYEFARVAEPTEDQKRLYRQYFNVDL